MTFKQRYGLWALITGASEGTGSAFASRLADEGVASILVARREGPLAETAARVRAKGVASLTVSADLSAPDAAARIVEAVGAREVGLLIANAGADSNGATFLDQDIAEWDRLVQINVGTTLHLVHHFGRLMRTRGRGGVILVGSGACYGGLNGIAVYSAAKGFLLNFGEALWAELRGAGVDVLNLILGRTDTPAHRRLMERNGQPIPADMASPEAVAEIGLARLANGPDHNWGQDDDIAGYAPNSAADRRARILAVEAMSRAYAGRK
ncbi:MAG TPA: SDR family NAD(P)-dependent oxidoreductase [Novosphingobium sp.]